MSGIHTADNELRQKWRDRFRSLPTDSRSALRQALLDLRRDALERAQLQWRRHKAPMALYWKVIGVYSGKLARCIND